MNKVTLFNGTDPKAVKDIPVQEALERIKNGNSKELIEKIRTVKDKDKRNEIKKNLPAITFSGVFAYRNKDKLIKSTTFAVLDFDNLPNPEEVKRHIFEDEHIMAAWISPSGNGVKAIITIPEVENDTQYKEIYNAALELFDIKADGSTKDISRLTYESYDPNILIKDDFAKVTIFEERRVIEVEVIIEAQPTENHRELFEKLSNGISIGKEFVEGQRNNHLFQLVSDCSSHGIPIRITSKLIQEHYPEFCILEPKEVAQVIRSGYSKTKLFNTKQLGADVVDEVIASVRKRKKIDFPAEVFPQLIQNFIKEQEQIGGFDHKLLYSTFLWAMATIIGNKATTYISSSWNVSPVMWMMIVAERGSNKTHTINTVIKPLKNIDNDTYLIFKDELQYWNPKSKEPRPTWKRILVEDGTREGFIKALNYNPGGVGLIKDELHGWLSDMDKHSNGKGGDESFWLSSYNNSSYTKDIKGDDDTTRVSDVFISLIGGIQPKVLQKFGGDHIENGLFDRFFIVPSEEKEFTFKLHREEEQYREEYDLFMTDAVKGLRYIYANEGTMAFKFDKKGGKAFEYIYNKLLRKKYSKKGSPIGPYLAKLLTQLPRICLIIEVTTQLANTKEESIQPYISEDSVKKAHKVILFFYNNAKEALFTLEQDENIKDIIKASKAIGKTDKAVEILKAINKGEIKMSITEAARSLGVSRDTMYNARKKIESAKSRKKV